MNYQGNFEKIIIFKYHQINIIMKETTPLNANNEIKDY